jgi:hypothetical protein
MGDFAGGGADNLDFSSHTYEQLRAAVYGVSEEAVRVAGNEWADLKRRLNERIGTLHVAVAKLTPAWDSPAGRLAIEAMRAQCEWLTELARIAELNESYLDDVQTTRVEAVTAMRALDSQPGGPVAPGTRARPAPSPGPATSAGGWVNPASVDWRQLPAVEIASRLYGRLAVAAASFAVPPSSPQEAMVSGSLPDDGSPRSVSGSSAIGYGQSGPVSGTPGSTSGSTVPGPGNDRTGRRDATAPGVGPGVPWWPGGRQGVASGADVTVRGPFNGLTGEGRVVRMPGLTSGGRGVLGGRPADIGTGSPGNVAATALPGKVIGGGLRPPPGTVVPPATVPVEPPPAGGIPGAGGAPGEPGGPGRKKPGYERAERDTFVDDRFGNPSGGGLTTAGEASEFGPLPGTVGQQKQQPTGGDQGDVWAVPAGSPEGFPDTLQSFTRRDGVTFEVRRGGRGA